MPKRMRLSRIFPEIKKAARQRARFDREAARIESWIAVDNVRVARTVTRGLIFTVLRDFDECSRHIFLSEIHRCWGSVIDVGAGRETR